MVRHYLYSDSVLCRRLFTEAEMITTVLFDLDGTLLPMDNDTFTKGYFGLLAAKLTPYGYDAKSLVSAVWEGTYAMVKNDGSRTNKEVFWDKFSKILGDGCLKDIPVFDEFYLKDFQNAKQYCGYQEKAVQAVKLAKQKGLKVALATNPIFPAAATESRISWAGLDINDFELYTTYENSRYCKPNPQYFNEIINKLNVTADECLMVGNDADEDTAACLLGMEIFIVDDCLINKSGKDLSGYPHGGFDKLINYIDVL